MDVFSFDREMHTLSYPLLPAYEQVSTPPSSRAPCKASFASLVYVRDPPAERPISVLGSLRQDRILTLDRPPGQPVSAPSTSKRTPLTPRQPSSQDSPRRRSKFAAYRKDSRMARKRRSLQAILIPSFLQSPLTSPTSASNLTPPKSRVDSTAASNYFIPSLENTAAHSASTVTSPRSSPPPSFLLDDDPFAKLEAPPFEAVQRIAATQSPPSPPSKSPDSTPSSPRSPLTAATLKRKLSSTPSSPPSAKSPPHSRATSKSISFGRMQPTPAYQRPAFAPKPSLPSLDALSRMNVVLTKRVRKGHVGATLPHEPWDNLDNTVSITGGPSTPPSSSGPLVSTSPVSTLIASSVHEVVASPPVLPMESIIAKETAVSAPFNASCAAGSDITSDATTSLPDQTNHKTDDIFLVQQLSIGSLSSGNCNSETEGTQENEGTEDTFDSPSLSALSPPVLGDSFMSLSRSASTSSSGSDDYSFGSVTSRYGNEDFAPTSSAESEVDFLNSPPEEYFSFPTRYTSTIISSWQSDADCGIDNTPSSSVYTDFLDEPEMMYQPGSSVGTVRPVMFPPTRYIGDRDPDERELVDSPDYEGYRGGSRSNYSYNQSDADAFKSYTNNQRGGIRRPSGGSGSGRRGNDDEDDDRGNRRPSRPSVFSATSSPEVTSDEDEQSADEFGAAKTKRSEADPASDDDVPLARRIPTALVAQKSIRKQVREERDQRRRERYEQEQVARTRTRSRQTTLRPAGTSSPLPHGASLSSSQEASLHATKVTTRPRTQTLPGRATPPLSAEVLTRKLQDVQVSSTHRSRTPLASTSRTSGDVDAQGAFGKLGNEPSVARQPSRALRPSRSFHRPQGRAMEVPRSVPMPANAEQKLERARSQSRVRDEKPTFEGPSRVPVPRISEEQRKIAKSSEPKSARPSLESETRSRPSIGDRPPVPPLPSAEAPARQVTQQRVFIGDMQRYNVVEIDDATSAGDVIRILDQQGSLKGWIGTGEWMVGEVAHDFGMGASGLVTSAERPVRSFERLSDVQASWNMDKMVNTFMVRLTPLAPLLSRSAVPSSSPVYAGYVEWESKRGKWSKRWLQLREHSLWISKRDNGKDEVLLCSLSNFDAYYINRLYKAPKPFVFAVKSTDKLSFFENASDYLHVISCSEKDGKNWIEKILVARSYVLHQERNVLFNPKSYGGQPTVSTSGPLSRSATHRRPAQPLVSVANNEVFEPGSLLHRQG